MKSDYHMGRDSAAKCQHCNSSMVPCDCEPIKLQEEPQEELPYKKVLTGRDPDLWEELNKLFDFPSNCSRIVITLEAQSVVTLDVTTVCRIGSGDPITKRYNLVEEK